MIKFALCTCLLLLSSNLLAGGGWVSKKGELYLKVGYQWVRYNQYYSIEGDVVDDISRSIHTVSIYSEYGISDRITAMVYFPFYRKAAIIEKINSSNGMVLRDGESFSSLGDTNISIKYGLVMNKPVVVSLSLLFGLPLGEVEQGSDGSLQTGDGEFNQMISVDVSGSFRVGEVNPYLSSFVGFNNRTNGYSDELRYGLETGLSIGVVTAIFKIYGAKSFNNGTDDELFLSNLLVNNAEYLIISPELNVQVKNNFGLSANFAKAVSGKLMFVQPSYTLGVYLNI